MSFKNLKRKNLRLSVKMTFNLRVWFRDLIRPKTESVRVVVYENEKVREIHTYDTRRQEEIMKAVEKLWETPNDSPYWFEVEHIQIMRMCRRDPPVLYATCYRKSNRDPSEKVPMNIPIRYRHKMLDKTHDIQPEIVGFKPWPRMQVKFRLLD